MNFEIPALFVVVSRYHVCAKSISTTRPGGGSVTRTVVAYFAPS
jgi:hypothetical protein